MAMPSESMEYLCKIIELHPLQEVVQADLVLGGDAAHPANHSPVIMVQAKFIETHIHIQQWYIKSLYNSKEIVPAGTPHDKTPPQRQDDVATSPRGNNDATMTLCVRWSDSSYTSIYQSRHWIIHVSMRVNRSPEAYMALIMIHPGES